MVADRVTVVSRRAGDPANGVRWESDGQGDFRVETVEKPARGTDVSLHWKEDETEFIDSYVLRQLVKKFSDFIEHPVVMDVEKEEDGKKTTVEETLNARKAIWLRSPSEVSADEYKEFYRQVSGNSDDPARTMLEAIDLIVPHQANKTMILSLAGQAGLSASQLYFNVDRMGNVSAASIPIALHDAVRDGAISRRTRVFTPGFGAGAVSGYAVLQFDPAIVADEVVLDPPPESTSS